MNRPCRRSEPNIWSSDPYWNSYDHHDNWVHACCFRGGWPDYTFGPTPANHTDSTPAAPDSTNRGDDA